VSRTFSTRDTGRECVQNFGRRIHKIPDIVKMYRKGKRLENCGMDCLRTGFCEDGNEPSSSIKAIEHLG
jgi:hypothetical protein